MAPAPTITLEMRRFLLLVGCLAACVLAPANEPVTLEEQQREVLRLMNQERARSGADAMHLDTRLSAAAQWMAEDLSQRGVLTHTDRLGRNSSKRVTEHGYRWRAVGENLARGQRSADQVVRQWMGSSKHKENLLSSAYSQAGLGVARSKAGDPLVWVLVLAEPLDLNGSRTKSPQD